MIIRFIVDTHKCFSAAELFPLAAQLHFLQLLVGSLLVLAHSCHPVELGTVETVIMVPPFQKKPISPLFFPILGPFLGNATLLT